MASLMILLVACLGSISNIPPPSLPKIPIKASPEILEWYIRSELICMEQEWASCEQALNRTLYYAPRDPFVLLRATEHAAQMQADSAVSRYLISLMPLLIQKNLVQSRSIQKRLLGIKEALRQ